MELYQLRYFSAVADLGNFTRAAESCNVSQPSLSQQILNLEKELGHKLFHRLGRRAVLTEAGASLRERTRRILFEVDDATKEIRDNPKIERTITIGAITTVAPYLLPPLLALCRERFPQIQVNIREDFSGDLIDGVLEGELDLAIVSLPVKDHRLSIEPLFSETLLLVLGKTNPLASKKTVVAQDLADETFALLGTSSSHVEQIQQFAGDRAFEPKVGYRCAQIATVKALVALGFCISILPQVTVGAEDRRALICRSLADRSPTREIGVIRHMQRYQSRGVEQFLALLREHTKKPAVLAG
jgi:LysR family transcriptional regulator, hydrogen peroxide-inducible genes activator